VSSSALRKPIRVAFIIGSLATGGAERQLIELLQRINRDTWQPSLVLFDDVDLHRGRELVDDVFSLGIPRGGLSKKKLRGRIACQAVTNLTRHWMSYRPDIAHAILPASFVFAVPAARFARVPAMIGSRRSLIDSYRLSLMISSIDKFVTRRCDFVIGNSEAVRRELIEIDGLAANRTATIYNGVDIDRFCPGDQAFRKSLGWTEANVVFGTVANFIPYKRHTDLVNAAKLISESLPEARFILAGEDRGILPEIRYQIASLGLQSKFAIVAGTQEPEALYRSMDIYICTSATEGLSNVLIEASATGLPIVATDVGGNAEVVSPGVNGMLVPARRPEAIARSAITIAKSRQLRQAMAFHNRLTAQAKFSLERMVREHESVYENILRLKKFSPATNTAATRVAVEN
jgi:glycosyltransferase involved in cell wall biosynthesis